MSIEELKIKEIDQKLTSLREITTEILRECARAEKKRKAHELELKWLAQERDLLAQGQLMFPVEPTPIRLNTSRVRRSA